MAQITVSFQGERGAFSEMAVRMFIGKAARPLPCHSYDSVFDAVEKGPAKYAVIPIENSLVGSVHRYYDLLLERKLKVIGEAQLRIVHSLIAPKGVTLSKVSKVYSHPVALEQCRRFFDKHPQIAPISFYDTAGAVKMLAESGLQNSAAIAGPLTAELYDMNTLKKSIEDEKLNFTRFLLLGKKSQKFKGEAKTSIVFSLNNLPGALHKALSIFALRDIDLSKLESRPVKKRIWQYYFYLDLIGSTDEERVQKALDHLSEITQFIKILGSYPRSI